MDNNDVLRRLRYALQLDDAAAARLVVLGGEYASAELAARWRLQDSATDFLVCGDSALRALLAGLISERRGARSSPPARQAEPAAIGSSVANDSPAVKAGSTAPVDNNLILKLLKIALSMRTDDIQQAVRAGGGSPSASEIGAFLRSSDSRNYRCCGDQLLRQFLTGLAELHRD